MHCRFVFSSAALALVLAVAPVQAQTLAFPPIVAPRGGPPPFKIKCIAGKPYSLVSKTTTSKRLADRTWTTTVLEQRKMRDSAGRERSELINGSGGPPFVSLTDPAAQTIVSLFAFNKAATLTHISLPMPPTPEQEARSAEICVKAAEYRAEHLSGDTTDLPPKTIVGASAEGKRWIITLHGATLSNGDSVRVVEETWTLPDLPNPSRLHLR
jgi:hypothetical protein